jgi:hypothetical protein
MPQPATPRKSRGCLIIGLVTFLLIVVGIILGVYFGTRKAIEYAVQNYTSNAPAEIPALSLAPAERKAALENLAKRSQEILQAKGPREIALSEQDLNLLIAQSPDLQQYKNQIYLKPDENQLRAFLSVPLDQFTLWKEFSQKLAGDKWKGRYLNGLAVIVPSVTNGVLHVLPKKIVVHATTLPDDFIHRFPWDNLTAQANNSPEVKKVLEQIDDIETTNSLVHIHFKP